MPNFTGQYLILIILILSLGLSLITACSRLPEIVPWRTVRRDTQVGQWLHNPEEHPEWITPALSRCSDAPFLFPSDGFIGFIWDDSFYPGHRHQGIDIFCGKPPGEAPIYAAYSGYLTRRDDWKSSIIIRIPEDPLHKERQIWIYYTHMADKSGKVSYIAPDFPPGTDEEYVEAGRLLGYQGNYAGQGANPVGVHLHFSVVRDDGAGEFLNELKIENTLDPSPYFRMPLNAQTNPSTFPRCMDDDSD